MWTRNAIVNETIAIHAAAGMSNAEFEHAYHFIREQMGFEVAERLPMFTDKLVRGAILGTVKVTGIVTQKQVDKGLPVSKWFMGPYGFLLSDPKLLAEPIHIQGQLMFWDIPAEIEQLLKGDELQAIATPEG
jgi:hypothetical protein